MRLCVVTTIGWKIATAKRGMCFVAVLPTLEDTPCRAWFVAALVSSELYVSREWSVLEGIFENSRVDILNSFLVCIFYQN